MQYPLLFTGRQAVTTSAVALPSVLVSQISPPGGFEQQGQGFQITLHALHANSASIFYGPAGVTDTTGQELAPGDTHQFLLYDLAGIFVIAAAGGSTVLWTVTNN
jgi:hypothetical protein